MNKELVELLERIVNELDLKRKQETDLGVKTGFLQAEWLVRNELINYLKSIK